MQKKLTDILSDPPHGLGTVANILLLLSLVLLLSIFFMNPEEHDVTLNLIGDKPIVEVIEPQDQLAESKYDTLFAVAKVGETIEKGDTLFRTVHEEDLINLNKWRALLKGDGSLPFSQMIKSPFIDASIKAKIRALSQAKAPSKNVSEKKIQELESRVPQLRKSIEEYTEAVIVYETYKTEYRDSFYAARDRYNNNRELAPTYLDSYKDKWDEYISIADQKKKQLQAENKYFEEEKSELEALKRAQSTRKKIKENTDYTFLEVELAIALDSVQHASVILAAYDGELEVMGDLYNVTKDDVLATFAREEIQSHLSERLLAEVKPKDADKVYPGRELLIYLENGSQIKGVVGSHEEAEGQFEILLNDPHSFLEVEEIILPANNQNFIEKVLDNF